MIELISLGLGAAFSLAGESERQKAEKQRREAILKSKIDKEEQNSILSNINRGFNTNSMTAMNNSALGLGSVLNPDTIKGYYASGLLGSKATAMSDASIKIIEHNQQVDNNLANNPIQPINIGNIIQGGLLGYEIGTSLDTLLGKKNPKSFTDFSDENKNSLYGLSKIKI